MEKTSSLFILYGLNLILSFIETLISQSRAHFRCAEKSFRPFKMCPLCFERKRRQRSGNGIGMRKQSLGRGRIGREAEFWEGKGTEQLSKLSAAIVLPVYLLFASCRVLILKFCNLTYLLSF